MTYVAAVVVFIILIALILGLTFGPIWLKRERPQTREGYGPPPGARRALSHEELDSRGWPEYPFEYTANTASAISAFALRSA